MIFEILFGCQTGFLFLYIFKLYMKDLVQYIKESYNDNDAVMLIRPKSLSQYILENRNR